MMPPTIDKTKTTPQNTIFIFYVGDIYVFKNHFSPGIMIN